MKKRMILFGVLSLILIAVLIWFSLPKETLASISGGELKEVRIAAYNPNKRSPPMYKKVILTEGELFDQYADFFYHTGVVLQPEGDAVYTEEATEYSVVYTFMMEKVEGDVSGVTLTPYGDGNAQIIMHYWDLDKSASEPQKIRLPSGTLFDQKAIHRYVWNEGGYPGE